MNRCFVVDLSVDRSEVDQFGFVDLRSAFENGIVPGNMSFEDETFNGVAAPALLLPHSQDVFESIRQSNYVASRLKDAISKERVNLAKDVSEKTPVVSVPTD